jgi:hypothetical protein
MKNTQAPEVFLQGPNIKGSPSCLSLGCGFLPWRKTDLPPPDLCKLSTWNCTFIASLLIGMLRSFVLFPCPIPHRETAQTKALPSSFPSPLCLQKSQEVQLRRQQSSLKRARWEIF